MEGGQGLCQGQHMGMRGGGRRGHQAQSQARSQSLGSTESLWKKGERQDSVESGRSFTFSHIDPLRPGQAASLGDPILARVQLPSPALDYTCPLIGAQAGWGVLVLPHFACAQPEASRLGNLLQS